MDKNELIIVADYEILLTREELCHICRISAAYMNDLLQYEIIHPVYHQQNEFFDLSQLKRIKRAIRLQRDLELNLAGVALVLDLLEQMEGLRSEINLIEKHYLNK